MEKEKRIEKIKEEINKLVNKESNIYFFVLDTKGNPSGSLEYIYKLAALIEDGGYSVTMLYQNSKDEEFIGVKEWLGDRYANISHKCVDAEEVGVSPSDVLFIPEIFSNLMVQTKKLPCKRIAILQNYDFLIEQMPFSVQWGDLGIMECITNTEYNAKLLNDIFPYVRTTVINPYIDEVFGETIEPKQMIINIVSKNQEDINKIVKPFYWKYPLYKWVSFREARGLSKIDFANALREAEITVWVDENASFGYTPLEAIKSGNIVLSKMTDNIMPWATNDGKFNDACIWFSNFNELHKMLASVIRAVITNKVPTKLKEDGAIVTEQYTKEKTLKEINTYIDTVLSNRQKEIETLLTKIEKED